MKWPSRVWRRRTGRDRRLVLKKRLPSRGRREYRARKRFAFAQMVRHFSCSGSGAETINIAGDRRKSTFWRTNEAVPRARGRDRHAAAASLHLDPEGTLSYRNVGSGSKRAVLVRANSDTIAALKAIRATPPPWRRLPPRPADSAAAPARSSRVAGLVYIHPP